jgi:hypothetical protein
MAIPHRTLGAALASHEHVQPVVAVTLWIDTFNDEASKALSDARRHFAMARLPVDSDAASVSPNICTVRHFCPPVSVQVWIKTKLLNVNR